MSWRECRLGDVLTLKRGHDLPDRLRRDGAVPVVSSSGITGYHAEAKAQPPGVVTGRYGTLGEVFFLEEEYWPLNTALYVIDFKENDPRFCSYFLKQALNGYKSDKAAVPGVDRNVLHELKVRVPEVGEQIRISQHLKCYDDLIENNKRRIELLEQSARLLYREWFVRLKYPGHEHDKIVDGLPQGWGIKKLPELCADHDGIQTGPFGSQLHQSDYTDEGVPVVMPKDIIRNRVCSDSIARIPEELADRLGRHRMLVGDIVYGRRGDIGRRAFIDKRNAGWFCGTGCLRIRPDPKEGEPRYLFEALGSPSTSGFIANQARGSTMPNLSAGALKNVPILYPPELLRRKFVEALEPTQELIEILLEQNLKLVKARDLLLPRLMDGRISL